MEIKAIRKEDSIKKKTHYKNGRIKRFLYYKCKDLIICKDLTLKGSPVVSVYPSMKNLVDKLKILKKMMKNKISRCSKTRKKNQFINSVIFLFICFMGMGAWFLFFIQILYAIILGNQYGAITIRFDYFGEMILEFWMVIFTLIFLGFFTFYLYRKQYKGKRNDEK